MNLENPKIGTVGLWHLGSVYSAGLAELGFEVVGYDLNKKVVDDLSQGKPPVYEKELPQLIQKNVTNGRLKFTSEPADFSQCDIIWLTMDTPIHDDGLPNISALEDLLSPIIPHLRDSVVLVVSSQVPIGFSAEITRYLKNKRSGLSFSYIYQPENLQLGSALKSFFEPGRVVIGSDKDQGEIVKRIFSKLNTDFCVIDIPSAEMTKHALNAFLGTSLSFTYDIADLCESYNADVVAVMKALRLDPRIGFGAYLDASLGFSGGTLNRDLSVLVQKAQEKGVEVPVIASVASKNKFRFKIAIEYIKKELGNLSDKVIGILGLTYKPGTSTLRDSLSLKLMKELSPLVREIRCHDPLVKGGEITSIGQYHFFSDVPEMCQSCHAVILMTANAEYANLDFFSIARGMVNPKIFIDGKNYLSDREKDITEYGIKYHGIGRRLADN